MTDNKKKSILKIPLGGIKVKGMMYMSCRCGNDKKEELYNNDACSEDVKNNDCICGEDAKNNEEEGDVKHKQRACSEKKALITRLSKIEGQVRGVKAMVEEDRYCVDILTQISAIQAALNSFNKELLARHIKTCVSDDIRDGNEDAVDELCELLKRLMK